MRRKDKLEANSNLGKFLEKWLVSWGLLMNPKFKTLVVKQIPLGFYTLTNVESVS